MTTERILPILALVAAFAIFFGYIHPTYAGPITALNAQITQYDSALDASAKYDARQAELTQQRNAIPADQLARIESYLPDGIDNVRLILDLNALAARSGITLSGFQIANGAQTAGGTDTSSADSSSATAALPLSGSATDSLDLTVTATGTYASFRTFLGGIESSLYPIDVTALDVKSSATGVYTYGMTLRVYWLQ